MTINPTNIPPAALPSSVKGGGNAPSKRPASGDPFASVIAQVAAGDEAGVAGKTQPRGVSLASRKRGASAPDDVDASAASSDRDADEPVLTNIAVPAWLWAVQDQTRSLGFTPLAQSQTGGASADPLDSTRSSDPGTAPQLGAVASLVPGIDGLPLAGPAGQIGASIVQTDQSGPSTGGLAPFNEQSEPALSTGANVVPTGFGAGAAANVSLASAARPAGPDAQSGTLDSQTVSSALADQSVSTQSTINPRRAGRAPAAYADAASAAMAPGLRAAGQAANGVAAATTLASSSPAASNRTADNLRSADRSTGGALRAANLSGAVPDGQSPLAAALLYGRAQNGTAQNETAQNPGGQDSGHASASARARAEEMQAPVAQALDAAVEAAMLHPDHAMLQTSGQGADIGHLSATEKTTLGTAVPFLSGSADRSAAIDDGNLHRQMVQAIQLQSHNGIGDARLTLQPEYLGEVTIALRVEDGGVTAHVSAASTDVRAWLGANEALLRQGLSEQGLTLDRLIVSDEPAEPSRDARGGNARQQQQQQPEQEPRPRQRRDASTFEITL